MRLHQALLVSRHCISITRPSSSRPKSRPNLCQLLDSVSPNCLGVVRLGSHRRHHGQLTIKGPLYSPPRSQFMPFESTIDLSRIVLPTLPRAVYGAIRAPALEDLPSSGRPERPGTRRRLAPPPPPKSRNARATILQDSVAQGRTCNTKRYPFRLRRDSPPHFDHPIASDPPDDPIARDSPAALARPSSAASISSSSWIRSIPRAPRDYSI